MSRHTAVYTDETLMVRAALISLFDSGRASVAAIRKQAEHDAAEEARLDLQAAEEIEWAILEKGNMNPV